MVEIVGQGGRVLPKGGSGTAPAGEPVGTLVLPSGAAFRVYARDDPGGAAAELRDYLCRRTGEPLLFGPHVRLERV